MRGIVEKIKREQRGKATQKDINQLLEMYGNLTPKLKEHADKYGYLCGRSSSSRKALSKPKSQEKPYPTDILRFETLGLCVNLQKRLIFQCDLGVLEISEKVGFCKVCRFDS
jgi:hypothetical protein